MTAEQEFATELRERYPELRIRMPRLIWSLSARSSRQRKLRYSKSIDITEKRRGPGCCAPKRRQWNTRSRLPSRYFRDRGALSGIPHDRCGGRNATVLHYETNQDPVRRDDLILTDIGAEVDGYAADITRTYPADGTFSPEQRAIYEAC